MSTNASNTSINSCPQSNQPPILVRHLRAIPVIADELMRCQNADQVFQRAVELVRTHFSVERCAIFTVEDTSLRGTYGTNIAGQTVDEHTQLFQLDTSWQRRFELLGPQDARWITIEETRRTWNVDTAAPVSNGWIAVTPIYSANELIDVLVNDAAISNSPVDHATQEVIAVFCSLLGSIIERKRAEDALRTANEELESRVSERTLELEASNNALQDEVFEHTLAQEALAKERTLLRTLIDNIPDYIFIKDAERRFLISNIAHAQSVAVSNAEDLNGKTAYDFYPQELAARFDADDRRVIDSGESLVGAERITLDAAGNRIWALTTKAPLRDQQGNVIGLVGISRDITDRKRAEEALANERTLLRTVIDTIPHLVWMKDVDGRFVFSNQYWADRENTTPDAIIGKTDLDINPIELAQKYRADDQIVIQSGRPLVDIEELNFTQRGEQCWLLTTKVPVRDAQGQITGVVGVARDITEQKKAQEALANERTLLRTVIDAVPLLMWMKDVEGRFVIVNQFCLADRELATPDVMIGKTDFDIHPLELAQKYNADDLMVIQSGSSLVDVEELNLTHRGEPRWVLTTKVPLRDAQGNITGLVGLARDITDRKRMEDALRTSEERYRSVVELSPDGIAVVVDERFVFVNQATADLFAVKDTDHLLGRSIVEYFHSRDRDVLQAAIAQVHHVHEPVTCLEMQLVQPDGQIVHCEMVIAPVTFNGKPAVQIIIRNITERVQVEQFRRESEGLRIALEKEQELGELKTKLMTTLSHELRTPLTIIHSSSEFLDRFFYRLSDEQRQERLHNIQSQVKKLTTLAEDISFLIRETLDHIAPRFDTIDLEQLCRGIIDEMAFVSDSRRNLHLSVEGHLNNVLVDPNLLNRIITNLLSNAIKYSSESEDINITLQQAGDSVVIQISDRGIGIPEQDKEHLFNIFHRGNNVGYISGTGLGLAIVREAVAVHGGTISYESTESVGTTFTVKLPLKNVHKSTT